MRVVYHDTDSDVGGVTTPALFRMTIPGVLCATVNVDGKWVTLVEAPESWHAAIRELGFAECLDVPDSLIGLEFVEGGRRRGSY